MDSCNFDNFSMTDFLVESTLCTPTREAPVASVPSREKLTRGCTEGSILNFENSLFPYDNILPFLRFAERESIAGNSAGS